VSVPAPSDIICFGELGEVVRKRSTRRSMAEVRTYVPIVLLELFIV